MINLTTPIAHSSDTQVELSNMGLRFGNNRVMLRVTLVQTGETRDYHIGNQPGDIDTIAGLVQAFPAFANLQRNMELYLAAKVAALGGNVP